MKSILILTSLTGLVAAALAGALAAQDDWARAPERRRRGRAPWPEAAGRAVRRPVRRAAGAA